MSIEILTSLFTLKELFLIGIIFLLLFTVFLLLVYAVVLRVLFNTGNAFYRRRFSEWETLLLEYLAEPEKFRKFAAFKLQYRDWTRFGEFIENYLVNLKGEDYDAIIHLLYQLMFNSMLMKAIDSSDNWHRTYAAYYLGLMKFRPAENKLRALIFNKSPVQSFIAFEAFSRIGSSKEIYKVLKFVLNSESLSYARVTDIVLSYGDGIVPDLIALLNDNNVRGKGKRLIIDVLVIRNAVEALPVIKEMTYDTDDVEVIIGCIKAMGAFGGPESIDFLMAHLSSPDWVLRSQAVRALGNVSSPEVIPELKMRIRTDMNYWVKLYSAQVLKKFGEGGIRELESILTLNPGGDVSDIVNYVLHETEE